MKRPVQTAITPVVKLHPAIPAATAFDWSSSTITGKLTFIGKTFDIADLAQDDAKYVPVKL